MMKSKKTAPSRAGPLAASGQKHCGAAASQKRLLPDAMALFMSWRRRWPKATMLLVKASKSKSIPSTTASPNGRRAELLGFTGPNMFQTRSAAERAASAEDHPPWVYVAPARERMMVFPRAWQALISSLQDVSDGP